MPMIMVWAGRAGGWAAGGHAPGSFGIYAERAGGQLLYRPPARDGPYLLPVVGAEVVLLERHRLAGALAEGVGLRLGVGAGREGRRAGVVGRRDPDVPVPVHAGPGGDELADDDVLLRAQGRVRLGVEARAGEHPGGLLEGGRRQPRL